MIGRLIGTRIRSNLGILGLFAVIHAMSFLVVYNSTNRDYGIEGLDTLELEMLLTLLIFVAMGSAILIREQREKRAQLIERLPVSMREAFIADWGFAAVCVCVPTLFWAVSILLITPVDGSLATLPSLVFWTTFFYVVAGALFGLIREIVSHSAKRIRLKRVLYLLIACALAFGIISLGSGRGGFTWPQLYSLAFLAAVGLIALDFRRRKTSDDYLA